MEMWTFLVLSVVVVLSSQSLGLFMSPQGQCCLCGHNITITLVAQNMIQQPTFHISVQLHSQQRELIYLLQQAVDIDERFKFTASYWGGTLGHYITSINNVDEDVPAHKNWDVSDQKGFSKGVSIHVPNHGDVILFNFTTY